MKCLKFTLEPDTLPIYIHVIFSDSFEEKIKFFREKTGEPKLEKEDRHSGNASFSIYQNHCLFEFDLKDRSISQWVGLIAHEAVHASWFIEKELGDMFDYNIQEPQCYLVQYLTQRITCEWLEHLKLTWAKDKKANQVTRMKETWR